MIQGLQSDQQESESEEFEFNSEEENQTLEDSFYFENSWNSQSEPLQCC